MYRKKPETKVTMTKVLILDQSKSMRNTLKERLSYEGFVAETTDSPEEASGLCDRMPFDLILTDRSDEVADFGIPFIVLAGPHGDTYEAAVSALRNGARDFVRIPNDLPRLYEALHRCASGDPAESQPHPVRNAPRNRKRATPEYEIIGSSPAITRVRELIDKIAPSEARVLITGENGTGKELVARNIHARSARAGAPFVEVNCAAIPSELIESELFGHERGAFTSAVKQRKGKFEQASGGTLFMDEIGDMSLSAQAKVLRALQERKISRVGSDRDVTVDVRIVAATNKDLRREIEKGCFREDLYHRLSVIIIEVPPLRDRASDIPELARYFIGQICASSAPGSAPKEIDDDALQLLCRMPWSGNIRELHNVIERLIILSDDRITAGDVRENCKV